MQHLRVLQSSLKKLIPTNVQSQALGFRVPRNPISVGALILWAPYSCGWEPIPEANKTPTVTFFHSFFLSPHQAFAPRLTWKRHFREALWRFRLGLALCPHSPALCFLLVCPFPSFLLLYNRIAILESQKLGRVLNRIETCGGRFQGVRVKEVRAKSVEEC